MNIKFITDEAALFLNDRILVVGDLHIGIEYELYRSGFSLPSLIGKMEKKILGLVRRNRAKILVLLGDVKHNVPQISIQEEREIPKFLENLSKRVEVHIVPGNHDGKIKRLSPKGVVVHPISGFMMDGFYFNHGHSWPGKTFPDAEVLVMAHSHPAVEFRDALGYRYVEPCWLICNLNKKKLKEKYKKNVRTRYAIIIPSFNPLISGMPVNREPEEPFIGPLMRSGIISMKNSDVYLLDGTHLGKVKEVSNRPNYLK
ncbi:MAG: metallophosphoesterase [Candidatus Aenigmarchaeota archaeon]|nr:metallophosphoesterase [Candidatus Aenigmarchaeota archaeon]